MQNHCIWRIQVQLSRALKSCAKHTVSIVLQSYPLIAWLRIWKCLVIFIYFWYPSRSSVIWVLCILPANECSRRVIHLMKSAWENPSPTSFLLKGWGREHTFNAFLLPHQRVGSEITLMRNNTHCPHGACTHKESYGTSQKQPTIPVLVFSYRKACRIMRRQTKTLLWAAKKEWRSHKAFPYLKKKSSIYN